MTAVNYLLDLSKFSDESILALFIKHIGNAFEKKRIVEAYADDPTAKIEFNIRLLGNPILKASLIENGSLIPDDGTTTEPGQGEEETEKEPEEETEKEPEVEEEPETEEEPEPEQEVEEPEEEPETEEEPEEEPEGGLKVDSEEE